MQSGHIYILVSRIINFIVSMRSSPQVKFPANMPSCTNYLRVALKSDDPYSQVPSSGFEREDVC